MEVLFALVYVIFSAIATLVWYFFLFVVGIIFLLALVLTCLGFIKYFDNKL